MDRLLRGRPARRSTPEPSRAPNRPRHGAGRRLPAAGGLLALAVVVGIALAAPSSALPMPSPAATYQVSGPGAGGSAEIERNEMEIPASAYVGLALVLMTAVSTWNKGRKDIAALVAGRVAGT